MAQEAPSANLNGKRIKIESMQLTLMTKAQIAESYETVFRMVSQGNPHHKTDPDLLSKALLPALYDASLQFWIGVAYVNNPNSTIFTIRLPLGLSTQLTTDSVFGVKRLWIASLYVDPRYYVMMSAWKEAMATLEIYAGNNQCDEINGMYTENTMLSVAKKLGFKNSTFLVKEL